MPVRSDWKRLLIEIAIVVVVALIGFGAWWWCARQSDAVAREIAADYEARIDTVRQNCEVWAASMAAEQAEAVLRSFAAGAYPSLMSGRGGENLDIAVGALLELPGVEFAHLLGGDGRVITSSDRKFTIMGEVPDRAQWALGVSELASRRGDRPGTVELAAPILSTAGTEAVLWMGYDTAGVTESHRPETLASAAAAPEAGEPAAERSSGP